MVMQISNALCKYQLVPLRFMQDGCAAGQTDVQLNVAEAAGPVALEVSGFCMPWRGWVVGISYDLESAANAGSLTIGPTIGGTECAIPNLTVTTGTTGSDTVNRNEREIAPFTRNAVIGAQITTDGAWNGNDDLLVTVWVILAIEGI